MFKTFCCFSLLFFIQFSNALAQQDSLELKLKLAYRSIGNNPSKAYQLATECLNISQRSENSKAQIMSLRILGQVSINKGWLEKADSALKAAMKIGEIQNLPIDAAHSRINYGNLELKKGSYSQALNEYNKAKQVFVTYNEVAGIIKATTNIGICHMYFSNYEAASIEYHLALQMAQKNDRFITFQGLIKNNLGRLQIKVKNYDKALSYLEESISLLKLDNNMVSIARGQTLIAKTLNLQNKTDEALQMAIAADSVLRINNDHQGIVNTNIVFGEIYSNQKKNASALSHFKEAINHAKQYELYELLNQAQIELGKYYLSNDELNLARPIITKAALLATELHNDENYYNAKKLEEALYIKSNQLDSAIMVLKEMEQYVKNLEGNYDRIKLLESENEMGKINALLSDLKISELKKSYTIIWLSVVIAAIILISLLIFWIIRTRQKNALLQYEKNEEALKAKNVAIQKNKEIESIKAEIKGQEFERKRLAKELHDGLGGTLSSIKLYLSHLQSEQHREDQLTHAIDRLDLACKEVRNISHHLTPFTFESDLLTEAIENFLDDLSQVSDMEISYEIFPKEAIEKTSPGLKNDVYRIIQELVSNVIKHAKAQHLDVQLIMHDDSLSLIVEDNGIGFLEKAHKRGIGLNNIQSRLELHQGKMHTDTHSGRGTVINIIIPTPKNE